MYAKQRKCCCCRLQVGLLVVLFILLFGTVYGFMDVKMNILNLILNLPRVITLTLVLFVKRDEVMGKWNYMTFLVCTVLSLPLNILGQMIRVELIF